MDSKKILLILLVISPLLSVVVYVFRDNLMDASIAVLGLILLTLGYVLGFSPLFFGFLFSALNFITSLPIISVIYGWIVFTLSQIHYILFNLTLKKMLGRMRWYRDLEVRVKKSRGYKSLSSSLDNFLRKAGVKSPAAMKIFQVIKCRDCGRTIPSDSKLCPYCGKPLT